MLIISCIKYHLSLAARDCLCLMASGSDFIKIKPGAREFQRQFYFDQETLSIHWLPSRKKTSKSK